MNQETTHKHYTDDQRNYRAGEYDNAASDGLAGGDTCVLERIQQGLRHMDSVYF